MLLHQQQYQESLCTFSSCSRKTRQLLSWYTSNNDVNLWKLARSSGVPKHPGDKINSRKRKRSRKVIPSPESHSSLLPDSKKAHMSTHDCLTVTGANQSIHQSSRQYSLDPQSSRQYSPDLQSSRQYSPDPQSSRQYSPDPQSSRQYCQIHSHLVSIVQIHSHLISIVQIYSHLVITVWIHSHLISIINITMLLQYHISSTLTLGIMVMVHNGHVPHMPT